MRYSLACSALAVALLPACSPAEEEARRTVSVTGRGKAAAAPDMATVQTGVVTKAGTADDALTANNKAMRKVMAALRELQVTTEDVQTSRFDVRPAHKRDPDDGRSLPEIAGYQVTNGVRVRVRELAELGKVLDALVRAGSNRLSGVSLSIEDPSAVADKARARAVADARRRAALYAKEAGAKLGRVLTISEGATPAPRPRSLGRAAFAADAASSVPVAAGEDEVHASVSVTFALDGAP